MALSDSNKMAPFLLSLFYPSLKNNANHTNHLFFPKRSRQSKPLFYRLMSNKKKTHLLEAQMLKAKSHQYLKQLITRVRVMVYSIQKLIFSFHLSLPDLNHL